MKHYSYYPGVLQFEISSNCNAQCPGCVRNLIMPSGDPNVNTNITNINIKTHPDIPKNVYLSLDVFKNIFTERVKKELKSVEFVGTIDDPLMHPKFLEMLEFLTITMPDLRIVIHSNSSLRTPKYFERMARILKNHNHFFAFSIDGLKDTNHLYRRKTNWNKIISNAQSFIDAGGYAVWQYLIFPWNIHQIEEAKHIAKTMGFREFKTRNDRSLNEANFKKLAASNDNTYVTFKEEKIKFDSIAQESEINCVMRPNGMYFINYEGNVWPCCFLNNQFYRKIGSLEENRFRFEKNYKQHWNNLHHHSIDEILNNNFYSEDLVDSWETTDHNIGPKGRIFKCTQTCSKKRLQANPFAAHTTIKMK